MNYEWCIRWDIILHGYKKKVGLILYWWNYIECYDVLHRHLIVNRGYELIVYKLMAVTKFFWSVGMSYRMILMVA